MACPVCTCSFTSTVRKPVTCASCSFESCQQCTKTYLLGTTQDAHCMNCRIAWSYNFLIDNFTKTFVSGDYKCLRENVLVEREKSMLVETMHLVDAEKEKRSIQKDLQALRAELDHYKKHIKQIKQQISQKNIELAVLSRRVIAPQPNEPRKQFIRACPAEDCKGFLSTDWKCGLCKIDVCSKCHDIKRTDDDHVCKPEDVQTASAVMRETKPCPKCAARIFKIDGCDQIWCTSCHTAFSWRTGKIETGVIHNPHYFEYLRKTGGALAPQRANNEPCGVFVNAREFVYHIHGLRLSQDPHPLINMLRGFSHIYRNQIPTIRDPQAEFATLRLRYLIGDFDEKHWKQQLQACEKRNAKRTELRMVLETLVTVSTDLFRRALRVKLPSEIEAITTEMNALIAHINESLETLAKRFGCTSINFIDPVKFTLESKA